MARPCKYRNIDMSPVATYFKPRGIPIHALEEIELQMDELEALRLADLEGLYQVDAAKKMNISRQTFATIVSRARHKVAQALINGLALKINHEPNST